MHLCQLMYFLYKSYRQNERYIVYKDNVQLTQN